MPASDTPPPPPQVQIPESIGPTWRSALADAFAAPAMAQLKQFLIAEKQAGKQIFPRGENWFAALALTPLDAVRAVILGQDPYHGPGQAHGLCFSVPPGERPPPSLGNIYKELQADLGLPIPRHGYLESWARQGVLMLNSVLTVEAGRAAAHQGRGWERFTDAVVSAVAAQPHPVAFLLWGNYAQRKGGFIEDGPHGGRHLVLRAAHPSPLSAHNGFLGCRHFSQVNRFLREAGRGEIDWRLPETV